ncbi:MAG: gamma-glutamyltransferase family protein [Longimicrobiales bacterium]
MPVEIPDAPQVAGSTEGVVVAAHPLAAEAGARMLRAGGNAADAAVAAAFAVSVVEPSMNSIGGRSQILWRTAGGQFGGLDATTQAPMTYDPETAPQASYGYPTIGIPGVVAGLTRLLEEQGTMTLQEVMAPAIELAAKGHRILPGEARRHAAGQDEISEFEGSRAYFLADDTASRAPGALFVQRDLAETLTTIASEGPDAFYQGSLAEAMVADLQAHGAAVTAESLADYKAVDSRIVRGSYRGFELVGTDLPASGAVTIGILHVLENFDMASFDDQEWAAVVGQAVAKGFEYRSMLGTAEDAARFLDKGFAAQVAAEIQVPGVVMQRAADWTPPGPARRSARLAVRSSPRSVPVDWTGQTWGQNSTHTTHLSTADSSGMLVALTQTIGPNLGSKVATPGLGFLYAATLGGYLGVVEPGERVSSSISPLMVLENGEPRLVLGAAGGARIVSAVVQAICRFVDQGHSLPDALAAARVHPTQDGIAMETSPGIGWTDEVVDAVEGWGTQVSEVEPAGAFGRIHGIFIDPETGERVGVADPDWEGAAVTVNPGPGR